MSPVCAHPQELVGPCPKCGICAHELVVNGACFYCGSTDLQLTVKPVPQELVPLKRRSKDSKNG